MKSTRITSSSGRLRLSLAAIAVLALGAAFVSMAGPFARRHHEPTPEDIVARYMTDTYGASNSAKDDQQADSSSYTARTCAERVVSLNGKPHILLAVCRNAADGDSSLPASIDLAVLRIGAAGHRVVVAEQNNVATESPDTHLNGVQIEQLGPTFFAFRINSTYYAQGYDISSIAIYAPYRRAFKSILDVTLHADNQGSDCGSGSSDCFTVDRTLTIDGASARGGVYDIALAEQRNDEGSRKAVFHFDRNQWQYLGPRGFELHPEQ